MRWVAALGAIAAEAWSRGEIAVRAYGQAVRGRQQERCGGCTRDLDGDTTTGDQGGGGQERGAASGVGAASDGGAIGEVSHRADQRSEGIAHGVRRSDAAGARRDQARYSRGPGPIIRSITGDGDRDLARTVCSAGCP